LEEKNEVIEMATEVVEETVSSAKKSKLAEAKELIENSKNLVLKAESEVEECKIGVSEAAKEFEFAKEALQSSTFSESGTLLEKLGFEYDAYDEDEPFELSLDRDDDDIFSVQSISTGRFTGLILALLAGLATLLGWIYLATKNLNINPAEITPETATTHVNPVLNWIGSLIPNGNMTFGALILGFSALIVAWIVYALRVGSKGRKNLRIAEETYEKSAEYCNSKEQCKKEMQKVDSHLKKATDEISNLKTVLDEQTSALRRVVHVEGAFEEEKEYHPTSKKIMRETEKVMRGAEILLNTAITKDGRLNETSVHALNNARAIYADYLARIYD
jgi:hypothetical protein